MKTDELLKLLENIKINEDELVDVSLLENIKRKEDVIPYILDTLTKTTNRYNSIIYINNGVVKYFSRSIDSSGSKNIIIKDNKAYDWVAYTVKKDNTVIIYVDREYNVGKLVLHLLDILPETPVTKDVYYGIVDLYNYLRRGYKIEFSYDSAEIEKAKALAELTRLVNIIAFGD
jgi:hypothetical protein